MPGSRQSAGARETSARRSLLSSDRNRRARTGFPKRGDVLVQFRHYYPTLELRMILIIRSRSAFVALIVSGVTLGTLTSVPSGASADDSPSVLAISAAVDRADAVMAGGESAGVSGSEQLAEAPSGGKYIASPDEDSSVIISKDPEGGVTSRASGDKEGISVSLPDADSIHDGAANADGDTVVYRGTHDSPAVAVQFVEGGLRIHTVISASSQSSSSDYTLSLESGERIVDESGLLVVRDANDDPRAYIAPAWAIDASGLRVRTWYTINASTITQHVDVTDPSIKFPVVADPYLSLDLIQSASWSYAKNVSTSVGKRSGWTLKVIPTGWAQSLKYTLTPAGTLIAGQLGWDELYSKYKNKGLNTNLGGMKDQYICHMQFVFGKDSWNLDEFRPNVSYADTVAKLCNP